MIRSRICSSTVHSFESQLLLPLSVERYEQVKAEPEPFGSSTQREQRSIENQTCRAANGKGGNTAILELMEEDNDIIFFGVENKETGERQEIRVK